MTTRYYVNSAPQLTLAGSITNSATSLVVSGVFTGWPTSFPFFATLDKGTASAEIVSVTAIAGTTATIARAQDGSAAVSHPAGATLDFTVIAKDFTEANAHINAATGVHGTAGAVVGTTDVQTLTNKTVTAAVFSGTQSGAFTLSGASAAASYTASGDGKVTGVLVPKTYATEALATAASANVAGAHVWLTAPTTGPVGPYAWSAAATAWLPIPHRLPVFKGTITAATALVLATNLAYTAAEDPFAAWSAANNNWVCPAPGLYRVNVAMKWNTTGAGTNTSFSILKNGTAAYKNPNAAGNSTGFGGINGGDLVRCAAGDTLSVQITGTAFTTQSDSPADNNVLLIQWIAA